MDDNFLILLAIAIIVIILLEPTDFEDDDQ